MIIAQTENGYKFDSVCINGEWFSGIGYQGLLNVNTKTYVDEPTRSNDGSIPNINDYDTFVVPRCKVNFKYFKIEDYQRLCRVINSANEFPVIFWDKQFGTWVEHNMYCEPEEMAKMFNVGTSVFGVLDYEISFIGTLNNLNEYTIEYKFTDDSGVALTLVTYATYSAETTYNKNDLVKNTEDDITSYYKYINDTSGSGHELTDTDYWQVIDSSILSSETSNWGNSLKIKTLANLNDFYNSPTEKSFVGWNTKQDYTGATYFANQNISIFEDLDLYPIWE
ncbi:MAG: hypothetical protein EOL95_10985 [Bacteroidia bacterium]|nr:hypothetical protein [Bacteroidia bacterium]